jgi:hypothetical protein
MSAVPLRHAELLTVLAEVRAMRAEITALAESVDHLARRSLEREDRRIGEALLPLVAGLVGADAFTAATLAATLLNARSPEAQAARELIADLCATEGGLRAFGKLLARLDGVVLGEHRLVPAGARRDGRLWRVRVLSAKNSQP